MMRKTRRRKETFVVDVEPLRAPTRKATEDEDAATDGLAYDGDISKPSGRISFDGIVPNRPAVNLCNKKGGISIGTWNSAHSSRATFSTDHLSCFNSIYVTSSTSFVNLSNIFM